MNADRQKPPTVPEWRMKAAQRRRAEHQTRREQACQQRQRLRECLRFWGPSELTRGGCAERRHRSVDPETRRLRALLKAKVVRVFQEADAETRETRLAALLDWPENSLDRLDWARAPWNRARRNIL
ncbi:MAG: hypothetical protein IPL51_08965 [Candidatus Competibacteraceae bacterium]|nr:hypothetical protein [Candidatus Competibacteraceae bacterium]